MILVMKYLEDQVKQVTYTSATLNIVNNKLKLMYVAPGIVDQFSINQATVRWSPPSQPNGIITGYQVIYSVYQIPSTKMTSNMLDNTITEFSIENLSK